MDREFFFEMLSTPSCSGHEFVLQQKVAAHYKPDFDKMETDPAGNLYAIINPEAKFRVLLCGHSDEICLRVTGVTDDGYLKVTRAGGIRPAMYLGHKVRVWNGTDTIYGSVVPDRELYKPDLSADKLLVDIGAKDKAEAEAVVKHGDFVYFDTDVRPLLGERFTARAIDDRSGVFVVMEAVKKAKAMGAKVCACACSTVGEETTSLGAFYAANRFQPDCGFAVDVTFATDYPSSEKGGSGEVKLDGGPAIDRGTTLNTVMIRRLEEAADKAGIHLQYEMSNGDTHTDEQKIQYSGKGVPTALVSIPLRSMHSPAEVGSMADIKDCIDLIAQFLVDLGEGASFEPYSI